MIRCIYIPSYNSLHNFKHESRTEQRRACGMYLYINSGCIITKQERLNVTNGGVVVVLVVIIVFLLFHCLWFGTTDKRKGEMVIVLVVTFSWEILLIRPGLLIPQVFSLSLFPLTSTQNNPTQHVCWLITFVLLHFSKRLYEEAFCINKHLLDCY